MCEAFFIFYFLLYFQVTFYKPDEYTDDWFNIFVLHQNRTEHGSDKRNNIQESALPNYLDLIVWGHEHKCRIEPEKNALKNFYVTQPGMVVFY